jgi:WD40 repeat protein
VPTPGAAAKAATPAKVSPPPSSGIRDARIEGNLVVGTNPISGAAFRLTLQHPDLKEPAALRVLYADISPDGHLLVTIHEDQTVCVWDATTGAPKTALLRHTGIVKTARISPGGDRLVTTSTDNTARLWWIVPDGASAAPPLRHHGTVNDAAFSPDGSKVATASRDHTARVWDAVTGEPITPGLIHPFSVDAVSFSSDGNRVTTRAADGSERDWELATDERPLPELRRLAQLLAGKRINDGVCWPLEPETLRTAWHEVRSQNPQNPEAVGSWNRGR